MLISQNKKQLVLNSLLELGEDLTVEKKGKGRKFVSRFIEPGVAFYQGFGDVLITKETLDKFIQSIVGCPLIINHKEITDKNADKERVGVISNVWYNEADGWYYCDGIIWDKQAIDLVKNQGWSVSCTYGFVSDNQGKTHNGKKIDLEFIDGNFLHLALVPNPRYERANIVINSKDEADKKEVENGFITLDSGTENERVIWIPENVHWIPPKERARVLEICDNYKKGDETKYDFSHTRVKLTDEQVKYLKDTVKDIENNYVFKGIAQIEISSSLNSGSFGVCCAPNNTSLISLAPSMYKENAQKRYDDSVKSGFHPKGTGEAIKSVLVHEIGHSITCNSKDDKFWSRIAKIRMDYMKNITNKDIKNPDFISNYARTNKYEFVAEAFCQGTLSKKYGKYTKQVMEAINEHFGKAVQTKLVLNEKDKEANDNEMWIEEYGFGYPIDEEAYKEMQKENETQRKQEEKENTDNKVQNRKDLTIMTVLKDLESFIKGIVDNTDDKDKKVENVDKRKLIDEVGGILKGKVDDEVWRTVIGKLEKIAYNPSETDKADNKCKNEDDEEKELKKEKFEEEKEIADNKKAKNEDKEDNKKEVSNSMDNVRSAIMGGNSQIQTKVSYVSQADRLKAGENY